jgi:hypothetical protein
MPKRCKFNNCKKACSYGLDGVLMRCTEHKTEAMKRIPYYVCIEEGCTIEASFNLEGETKRLFCKKHKKENMVKLDKKQCKEKNCNIEPTYGYFKREYCTTHKKENMIIIHKKKVCLIQNCNVFPTFNYINEKVGIYCKLHKYDNMIDVINKRCENEECQSNTPCFNYPNEKRGRFCINHALKGMVNVKSKKCLYDSCIKQPNYNYKNKQNGIYCNTHKLKGMENVKAIKCKQCDKRPSYNYEGEDKAIYCKNHKLENMVNIKSKRCIAKNCIKIAIYNLIGHKPEYCSKHMTSEMINVSDPRCKTEGCYTFISKNYNGYCIRCFIHLFPDNIKSRSFKIKEKHMVDFVKENFPKEKMVTDKIIYGGCSKRRPDIYIDKYTHVIIIECDENQHKNYNITCENKRTMELFIDFGNRPIVLIRFNPDSYIDENGKKFKSCFSYHKLFDIPCTPKSEEWKSRLCLLKQTINKYLNEIPQKEVTIEHLFYNYI